MSEQDIKIKQEPDKNYGFHQVDEQVIRPINWRKYNVRTCMSLHECKICRSDINLGEIYFDGGYSRRAHVECVEKQEGV